MSDLADYHVARLRPPSRLDVCSGCQRSLHHALQFLAALFIVTHESLDYLPAPIEDDSLRDKLISAHVGIDEFIIRKTERILNIKLFRILGNFCAVVLAANVQTD